MKQTLLLIVLILAGALAWYLADRLSPDALGFGLGAVFGMLAGLPAALLVLAADRRKAQRDEDEDDGESYDGDTPQARWRRYNARQEHYPAPAPLVIVTGGAQPVSAAQPAQPPQYSAQQPPQQWPQLPAPPAPRQPGQASARTFKIVGEKEEWLDEW